MFNTSLLCLYVLRVQLMEVRGWLANALDCKSSGQARFDYWTRQGEGPFFFTSVSSCADSSMPVPLSCAQQVLSALRTDPMSTLSPDVILCG